MTATDTLDKRPELIGLAVTILVVGAVVGVVWWEGSHTNHVNVVASEGDAIESVNIDLSGDLLVRLNPDARADTVHLLDADGRRLATQSALAGVPAIEFHNGGLSQRYAIGDRVTVVAVDGEGTVVGRVTVDTYQEPPEVPL